MSDGLELFARAVVTAVRFVLAVLLEGLTDYLFYWTARLILPVLSLGFVRVERVRDSVEGFGAFGLKRLDGHILLSQNAAALSGFLLWIAIVAFVVFLASNAPPAPAQASSFAITSSEIS